MEDLCRLLCDPNVKTARRGRWFPWNEFHNGPIKTKKRDSCSEIFKEPGLGVGEGSAYKEEALSSIYEMAAAKNEENQAKVVKEKRQRWGFDYLLWLQRN